MGVAVQHGGCGVCHHDFMSGPKIRVWRWQHGHDAAWWGVACVVTFHERPENKGVAVATWVWQCSMVGAAWVVTIS